MKCLIICFVFLTANNAQQNEHAIYFENFESIEYEIGETVNTLIFALNNEKGMNRILIIKIGPDEYMYSKVYDGGHTEPVEFDESDIRSLMTTLIKYYMDKYSVTLEQMTQVTNLIYR